MGHPRGPPSQSGECHGALCHNGRERETLPSAPFDSLHLLALERRDEITSTCTPRRWMTERVGRVGPEMEKDWGEEKERDQR